MLSAFKKFVERLIPVITHAIEEQKELAVAKRALEERDRESFQLRQELDDAVTATELVKTELSKKSEEHRNFVRESEALHRTELTSKSKEISDLRKTLLAHKDKVSA